MKTDSVHVTADWPKRGDRFLCTSDHPMPAGAEGAWIHPEARDVGECFEGCCDDFECPACGHTWREEAAQ